MTSASLLLSAVLFAAPAPRVMPASGIDTIPVVLADTTARDSAMVERAASRDTVAPIPALARDSAAAVLAATPRDTVRPRPKAIEVSDAYELRLRIHRYASYTMIPLFAIQSISGNQLYVNGGPTPQWANSLHSLSAAGLGTVFTINTVTGLWNLWESRDNEVGRVKRWLHSALLLGSDAGFAYAGIKLGSEAKHSQSARDQHRRIAYYSMGAAVAGYAVMLIGDH